jgi:hypothetical protein
VRSEQQESARALGAQHVFCVDDPDLASRILAVASDRVHRIA